MIDSASWAAVPKQTVGRGGKNRPFYPSLIDENATKGAVVLRSKYETGRRFNLARLIGDRVAASPAGRLMPATRTFTYRQKLQRAFAGEFLLSV